MENRYSGTTFSFCMNARTSMAEICMQHIYLFGRRALHGSFHFGHSGPASSGPSEEVNVGKLFHLLHVPLRLDDFLVIEKHPAFSFLWNFFPDEGHIMPAIAIVSIVVFYPKNLGFKEQNDLPSMNGSALVAHDTLQPKSSR